MKARPERPEVFPTPHSSARGANQSARDTLETRTVAIVGHRSSGKTSLCELLLQAGRVVREQGSVEAGTTLFGWTPLERRHLQTLEISSAWIEQGQHILQIMDTPGAPFLEGTRDLALSAADAALVVVDSSEGVKIGTEEALKSAHRLGLPVVAVAAKWKAQPSISDFFLLLAELTERSGLPAVPLQLPFADERGALVGLVDILEDRVLRFDEQGLGAFSPEPVPLSLKADVDRAREQLYEAIASTDDRLLEHYLEYFTLPAAEVRAALPKATHARKILPVFVASSSRRIGAAALLEALVELTPPYGLLERRLIDRDGTERPIEPDGPFVAQVLSEHRDDRGEIWHLIRLLAGKPPAQAWVDGQTGQSYRIRKLYRVRGPRRAAVSALAKGMLVATWDPLPLPAGATLTAGEAAEIAAFAPKPPMFALWIRPVHPKDEPRFYELLQAVTRADRGLSLLSDDSVGALLLAGQDESHVRIAIERMQEWSGGIGLLTELPPVGYVETPAATVQGVEGIHVQKDGDGLVEEYGKCEVAIEPTSPEEGTRFVDAVEDEEDLPVRYRPAISEGALRAMMHGPTAGYPVIGVQLHLTGGDYDILQSTDDHFRLAGEKAVRSALERVGTRVLEPWWQIEITAPQLAVGDLLSDIAAHRGRILGVEVVSESAYITAHIPYREMRTFGTRLQTMTGGRGHFSQTVSHYEPLPEHLLREAIEASPHRAQEQRSTPRLAERAARSR